MGKYTVKKGDNLSSIAKKNGLTLKQLLELNPNIKNVDNIQIGQNINLNKNTTKDSSNNYFDSSNYQIKTQKSITPNIDKLFMESVQKGKDQYSKIEEKRKKEEKQYFNKNKGPVVPLSSMKKRQEALREYGYTGRIDGIWGKGSEAALARAKADGYDFDSDDNLIKQKAKLQPKINNQDQDAKFVYNFQTGQYQPNSELNKAGFGYSAVTNTITDAIGAPIKRFLNHTFGINIPAQTFNESDLTPEHYEFWQEAIEKKWPKKERDAYFAKNPDAQVKKGWIGRITPELRKKGITQSDYKKYFGENYDGPMARGLEETMSGRGISQAMGTIGSGNLIYTKDGVYLSDDWDFKGTGKFDTSNFTGVIRQFQENYGSQENDDTNPVRNFKGLIKYK